MLAGGSKYLLGIKDGVGGKDFSAAAGQEVGQRATPQRHQIFSRRYGGLLEYELTSGATKV